MFRSKSDKYNYHGTAGPTSSPWCLLIIFVCLLMPVLSRADMSWEEMSELFYNTDDAQPKLLGRVFTNYLLRKDVVVVQEKTYSGIRYLNTSTARVVIFRIEDHSFVSTTVDEMMRTSKTRATQMYQSMLMEKNNASQSNTEQDPQQVAERDAQLMQYLQSQKIIQVEKTNESDTLDEHPCKKYLIKDGEETLGEVWVADDIQTDGYYQNYAVMAQALDPIIKVFLKSIPGFPMKWVFNYGKIKQVITVQHISFSEVPLSMLLLPDDAIPGGATRLPSQYSYDPGQPGQKPRE